MPLKKGIKTRANLYNQLLTDQTFKHQFNQVLNLLRKAIKNNNKILIFGNGGSAADASHFAAELVCQYQKMRKAIAAISLAADPAILTAISNDFGFEYIFIRQIEALCQPGDVVIGLTTSDAQTTGEKHSVNILKAFHQAKAKQATNIGFFSAKTRRLLDCVDLAIIVPSEKTSLIQEVHQMIIHELCEKIEEAL